MQADDGNGRVVHGRVSGTEVMAGYYEHPRLVSRSETQPPDGEDAEQSDDPRLGQLSIGDARSTAMRMT